MASLPWFKGEAVCLPSCLCCPVSSCSPGCTETTQGTSSKFFSSCTQSRLLTLDIDQLGIHLCVAFRGFSLGLCVLNVTYGNSYNQLHTAKHRQYGHLACCTTWHGASKFTRKLRPAKWASRLATSSTSKSLMNLPRCHTVLGRHPGSPLSQQFHSSLHKYRSRAFIRTLTNQNMKKGAEG